MLERQQQLSARFHRLAFVGVGQKGAVGGDLRLGVEDPVNGLKAQIGHRHRIDVGIHDTGRDIAPEMAPEQHPLAGDSLLGALTLQHG